MAEKEPDYPEDLGEQNIETEYDEYEDWGTEHETSEQEVDTDRRIISPKMVPTPNDYPSTDDVNDEFDESDFNYEDDFEELSQYSEEMNDEQLPEVPLEPEATKPYRSRSNSSAGSDDDKKEPSKISFFQDFVESTGVPEDETIFVEETEEPEEWMPFDSLEEEELGNDGWTLHYDASMEEEEEFEREKDIEFIYERHDVNWDLDVNDTEEEHHADYLAKLSTPRALPSSDEEFFNENMKIPNTPANERLSKEAALATVADSKIKYYPSKPILEYESSCQPRMHGCPSIESFFRIQRMVDVQFYLYPGSKMISKDCRISSTIHQLKTAIGRYVKVPPQHLDIRKNKSLVGDDKTLLDLGAKPKHKIKFTVEINKRSPGSYEITMPKDRVLHIKPDTFRKVRIDKDDGGSYYINLTISYPTELKQMLGGFIDQRSKLTYHHAITTMEQEAKPLADSQVNAPVQAFGTKIFGIQTLLDKAQQMEKRGLYIPEQHDKVLYAKPYFPHAYFEMRKTKAAIVIQRYWRRWLAIQELKRREEGLIKRVKWAENIRKGRLEQRMAILNEETKRQEHPKRLVDLELVYRAINAWRKEEEAYVEKNRWGPERLAALATLAELEADLLLDLERTKNTINVQERENRNRRVFEKMGEPRRWLSDKSDKFVTVDCSEKFHVRQLQLIYSDLLSPVEKNPQGLKIRCALLAQLNLMTKHVKSKMATLLTELVSRELSYLRMPKCSNALLAGVRRRMATTFFFLCQDPDFNPEAKRVQKVPWDPVKLRKDMVQCKGCRRMQYRDEFTIIKGTTVTSRCHTCMNLYRTAILRVDLNLYRHMLKELRREELAEGVVNSATFLIDAFDLQFLVEQIWHGQSALSGIDNRYILRLCRWKKDKPWAPWNCVLLTEEEATAHLQLDNMQAAYKGSFFHKVLVKQCTAKTYFEGISKLTIGLDSRIDDTCKAEQQKNLRQQNIKDKMKKKIHLMQILKS